MLRGAVGLLRAPPGQQRGHIPQIHGVRVAPFPPPRPPPPSPEAEPLPPLPPPPVPPAPLPVLAAGLGGVSPLRQQQDQTLRAGPDAPPHHGVLLERARWRRGAQPGGPARPGGERGTGRVTQRAEPTSKGERQIYFFHKGGTCYSSNGRHGIGGVAHTHPRTIPQELLAGHPRGEESLKKRAQGCGTRRQKGSGRGSSIPGPAGRAQGAGGTEGRGPLEWQGVPMGLPSVPPGRCRECLGRPRLPRPRRAEV